MANAFGEQLKLHKALDDAGMHQELYERYVEHLRLILEHVGRQPDRIQVENGPAGQTVTLRWWAECAVFTVTFEELPF